jgi:hypothetical protein
VEQLKAGALSIMVEKSPSAIRLHWQGSSSDRDPGAVLNPFLARVMDPLEASGPALELHFEALEYLNSSTLSVLMRTIQKGLQKRLSMVVVYDTRKKWQVASFTAVKRAVKTFEQPDSVQVEFRDLGEGEAKPA